MQSPYNPNPCTVCACITSMNTNMEGIVPSRTLQYPPNGYQSSIRQSIPPLGLIKDHTSKEDIQYDHPHRTTPFNAHPHDLIQQSCMRSRGCSHGNIIPVVMATKRAHDPNIYTATCGHNHMGLQITKKPRLGTQHYNTATSHVHGTMHTHTHTRMCACVFLCVCVCVCVCFCVCVCVCVWKCGKYLLVCLCV